MERSDTHVDPTSLDVVMATTLTGLASATRTCAVCTPGFEDLRRATASCSSTSSPDPLPVGALARRMGVSQQAASKATGELERLGYLERVPDPGRRPRAADRLGGARGGRACGPAATSAGSWRPSWRRASARRRLEAMRATLVDVLTAVGGAEAVRARRVPGIR